MLWRLRRWKISIPGGSQAGNWWLPRRIIFSWYSDPYYDTVFPFVSPEQLSILRELTDSICAAAGQLLHKVERTMKT